MCRALLLRWNIQVRGILFVLLLSLGAAPLHADVRIVISREFIETYRDRATMDVQFTVAHTHHKAKAARDDGDIHCAGTAPEVGLACVAEVLNAKAHPRAISRLIAAESDGDPVSMRGVWRLWPEHASGGEDFIQFDDIPEITGTNPPHVFEIHPLVSIDTVDVRPSFRPVSGYAYKDAAKAFAAYENHECGLHPDSANVTIVTKQLGYNYVKFRIRLLEAPSHVLQDGSMTAYATVLGPSEEEPLVSKVRCIFVQGTRPFAAIHDVDAETEFTVIGLPRVSLALLRYRVAHGDEHPELLTRTLPYELVICGLVK